MRIVLYFSLVALLVLMWCLIRFRRRLGALQREVDGLRQAIHAL
jgi:hypothetical protein